MQDHRERQNERDRLGNRWMRFRCGHRTEGAGTAWHNCENRYSCGGVHIGKACSTTALCSAYIKKDIREKQTKVKVIFRVTSDRRAEAFKCIQYES